MENEQYLQTQQNILLISGIVADMPLSEFIEAAERADTVGPITNPSLWRDGHKNLSHIIKLARGLEKFQEIINDWKRIDPLPPLKDTRTKEEKISDAGCTPEHPCCDRRGEYNGYHSGPLIFECPNHCPCHD